MMRRLTFLCALALMATISQAQTTPRKSAMSLSPADAAKTIQTRTLKNGMKIVVWPDHDIPNVALYNWFRVGSRNEYAGITGLSHFFEHMMFNGAKKYGAGEFDRVMEARGGANNAYTSENVTVYQDWFPKNALELIFDLEADRMRDLAFDPKIIDSERGVVYSERRSSVDNQNENLLSEQVQATAFVAHPYGIPTIGWPSDIESWKHEDLVLFFKTYYAPNNATMIVVGDVTPAAVFALAEKYIEPIPSQKAPDPIRTKEPEQLGERRVELRRFGQTPAIQMAFHNMAASDPDMEALQLLLTIIANGDSSRLNRKLVEEDRSALSVGGFNQEGFDPFLTWIVATLPPGCDLAKVEKSISDELVRVSKDGVTDAELRKAKNIAVANFWRSLKTISGKAQALGTFETFKGGYGKLFDAPIRYEAVTREQIQKVAAKVFAPKNRTVGVVIPTEEPAEQKEATQ